MNQHHMKQLRALREATSRLRLHFESLLACNEDAKIQDTPTTAELLSRYDSACDLHTQLQDCIFDFGHGQSKTADSVLLVASFHREIQSPANTCPPTAKSASVCSRASERSRKSDDSESENDEPRTSAFRSTTSQRSNSHYDWKASQKTWDFSATGNREPRGRRCEVLPLHR